MKTTDPSSGLKLTQACWPVFEFVINFSRQVKHGAGLVPEEVRFEAVNALRDAEDLAARDPATEKAWVDRVKAMMVYFIDYRMLTTPWAGGDFWFQNRLENSRDGLNHVEALGGEKFFQDCDELQKDFEQAEKRERRDKDELAEQLNLYYMCLRLGFRGQFHDRPQELNDYTRRLFMRLPSQATTRSNEWFPDAYKHNQELKVDYRLGVSLAVVCTAFALILIASLGTFRIAWSNAVSEIRTAENRWSGNTGVSAPAEKKDETAADGDKAAAGGA